MLIRISDQRSPGPATRAADAVRSRRPVRAVSGSPDFDRIEFRAARIGDMVEVEPLIRGFANDNLMLPKGLDQLTRSFREFVVAVDGDGYVVGCGALRVYTEGLAEVCSLAVDPRYQGHGVGRGIVDRLVGEARALGLTDVFALTLRPEFFEKLGFAVAPKEDFPLKVWADCRSCPKLHACDEIAVARQV